MNPFGKAVEQNNVHLAADQSPVNRGVVAGLIAALEREDMQEYLDRQGASNALLDIYAEREEKAFSRVRQEGLPQDVRAVAVWLMVMMVKRMRLPEKSWFDVVLLFDLYCQSAPMPVKVTDLPALCGAVARLLLKMETCMAAMHDGTFMECTMLLAQYLRQAGHTVEHAAITDEDLETQEQLVLQVLRWQINLPSVSSWMSLFHSRMFALSGPQSLPSLTLTWQYALYMANSMVMKVPSTLLAPRHVTQGFLCLGFVAARLVPPEAVGLKETDDLQGLVSQELPAYYTQGVAAGGCDFYLGMLQVATGSSLAVLVEDCVFVRDAMASVMSASQQGSADYILADPEVQSEATLQDLGNALNSTNHLNSTDVCASQDVLRVSNYTIENNHSTAKVCHAGAGWVQGCAPYAAADVSAGHILSAI